MSIATKTGDAGTTALMFNRRVSKCHPRVEAYGCIDELTSAMGVARACADPGSAQSLLEIQKELVGLMGELATQSQDLERYVHAGLPRISKEATAKLDALVQDLESRNISYHGWATPGATVPSAALDVARTICRRAERRVCALHELNDLFNPEIIVYLNRLSDLLWLLARAAESPNPPQVRLT